jgi:hypothetical protein
MPEQLPGISPMCGQFNPQGDVRECSLSILKLDRDEAMDVNDKMSNKGQDDKEKSAKAPLDVILIEKRFSCFDVGVNVKSLKQNA